MVDFFGFFDGGNHMARTVGIGIQNFEKMIKSNYFYVDKTSSIFCKYQGG